MFKLRRSLRKSRGRWRHGRDKRNQAIGLDGKPIQENINTEKRDATDWSLTELVAFVRERRADGRGISAHRRVDAQLSLISSPNYIRTNTERQNITRLIAEQLERIERGEIDRLMLLVPPRHGKSELASHRFPAWFLGRQPDRQFLSVSATESLASDFGRAVRNTISSPEYRAIFDRTTLAEDSQAKGKWHTGQGGVYYSLGIGGSVLGRGADCMLIDDPYASMA